MLDNPVALDIETSDGRGGGALDPREPGSSIALVQFAYPDGRVDLIRWGEEALATIKAHSGATFVIHNAAFELDWLLVKAGIFLERVWCTMLASQILNAGRELPDEASRRVGAKKMSHSLGAVVFRYTNQSITKDQATSDWSSTLTAEQERYARDDVKFLLEVATRQRELIQGLGLEAVANLEMKTAIAVNEMRFRGIQIDRDGWETTSRKAGDDAEALAKTLNHQLGMELSRREGKETIFGFYIPRTFNVSSSAQLAKFFGLKSADEAILKGVDHPLIPDILQFKKLHKLASTYGKGYLEFISSDGRIHSQLPQAETATGRFKSRKPNLQNIPPEMLRSLLRAAPGRALVFADYSAIESRILAYVSGDENFISSVNSGDVHWENAKKIFGLPKDASKKDSFEVKLLGKTVPGDVLRRMSKGVSFGIPYGISASGLVSRGFAESIEIGEELISGFLSQYPKVARFLKHSVAEALSRGYTQDPFGRIRWYELPEGGPERRKAIGMAARQAQNHKIQSMSANITKQAIVDLDEYLRKADSGYMVLTIHDSIIFEIDEDALEETLPEISRIMEDAGPKIFPGMVSPVDISS